MVDFGAVSPEFLKARFGTSELFTTIMLLFMAGFITDYFASGPWRAPEVPDSISSPISASGFLPKILGGPHIGFIIAIIVGVAMYFLIEKSVLGYKIRAMGDNPEAASLAGINIPSITVWPAGYEWSNCRFSGRNRDRRTSPPVNDRTISQLWLDGGLGGQPWQE